MSTPVRPTLVGMEFNNYAPTDPMFSQWVWFVVEFNDEDGNRTVQVRFGVVVCSVPWIQSVVSSDTRPTEWSLMASQGISLATNWIVVERWDPIVIERFVKQAIEEIEAESLYSAVWFISRMFSIGEIEPQRDIVDALDRASKMRFETDNGSTKTG